MNRLAQFACAGLILTASLALSHRLPATPESSSAAVSIDNFSFNAPELRVRPGTRVTWTNHDDIPHTVTADGIPPQFRSHPLDTGETFSMVFGRAGTYHYFCSLHPKMRGTVTVQ